MAISYLCDFMMNVMSENANTELTLEQRMAGLTPDQCMEIFFGDENSPRFQDPYVENYKAWLDDHLKKAALIELANEELAQAAIKRLSEHPELYPEAEARIAERKPWKKPTKPLQEQIKIFLEFKDDETKIDHGTRCGFEGDLADFEIQQRAKEVISSMQNQS